MKKNTTYAILFILTLVVTCMLSSCSTNDTNTPLPNDDIEYVQHQCNWEDCNHQGELMDSRFFVSYWGYENETDGFYTELTHFINPEMTYEQCEDYVMSGVE